MPEVARFHNPAPSLLQRLAAGLKAMRFSGAGGSSQHPSWWVSPTPGSQHFYESDVGPAWLNSAVAACLGWIQTNFTEPHLCVRREYRDAEAQDLTNHPLVQLVDNPNPFYSSHQLWQATLTSYCCAGNAYWLKARGDEGDGRPLELFWVPHWQMRPAWDSSGREFITHYVYTPDGHPIPQRVEDVVHFRYGFDPFNYRLGLAPLAAVYREIAGDNEASTFTTAILKNSGVLSLSVSPKGEVAELTPDQAQRVKESIMARTGDRRGEPIVHSVPVDIENVGFSPEQLALDRIRYPLEERICAALKIPPGVVGLGAGLSRNTFSNYAEAREAAFENCIIPLQKSLAAELTKQLLPDFAGSSLHYVTWDYSRVRVLQEDENAKFKRWTEFYRYGGCKRNVMLRALGLDEVPAAEDVYYSPTTGAGADDPLDLNKLPRPATAARNGNGKAYD